MQYITTEQTYIETAPGLRQIILPVETQFTPTAAEYFSKPILRANIWKALPPGRGRDKLESECTKLEKILKTKLAEYPFHVHIRHLQRFIKKKLAAWLRYSLTDAKRNGEYKPIFVIHYLYILFIHLAYPQCYNLININENYYSQINKNVTSYILHLHKLLKISFISYQKVRPNGTRPANDNITKHPGKLDEVLYSNTVHAWITPRYALLRSLIRQLEHMFFNKSEISILENAITEYVARIIPTIMNDAEVNYIPVGHFNRLQMRPSYHEMPRPIVKKINLLYIEEFSKPNNSRFKRINFFQNKTTSNLDLEKCNHSIQKTTFSHALIPSSSAPVNPSHDIVLSSLAAETSGRKQHPPTSSSRADVLVICNLLPSEICNMSVSS
jgi:hypothetical protein